MNNLIANVTRFRAPLFLILCILLGGTSQPIFGPKIFLYVLSTLIIATIMFKHSARNLFRHSKFLMVLLLIYLAYGVVQLIPLPPGLWSSLPGRGLTQQGYEAMELAKPWLPIAMVPADVLRTLLSILPAIALFLLVTNVLHKKEIKLTIWFLLVGAFLSVILGVAQVVSGSKALYFYEITNENHAVGVFSNNNHQATLMALAATFSLTLMLTINRSSRSRTSNLQYALCGLFSMAFMLTLLLNASSAGYILMVVMIIATGLSFLDIRNRKSLRIGIVIGILILAIVLVDFFFLGNAQRNFVHSLTDDGATSRQQIFSSTWQIIRGNYIFGSGLGAFQEVYAAHETTENVTSSFVNHTHNDFLELIMEMGIVGFGLLIGLVIWWGKSVAKLVKASSDYQYAKAGAIALLIVFVHSFVDYPIRTLAISAIVGLSAGLVQRGVNSVRHQGA